MVPDCFFCMVSSAGWTWIKLNPALTVVSPVLSPLLQRLCLLRRSLPLLFLTSEGPASLAVFLLRASKTILTRAKVGHECGKSCHGLWFFLAEVPGKPFVTDAVFKGREGFGIRTVN